MSDTVRRAMELAASGKFSTIEDLQKALKREGCVSVLQHTAAPTLRRQLRVLMQQPRP